MDRNKEEDPVPRKMTDEERIELAKKLDDELNEFIDKLEKKPYAEGWPEDRWEEEMEKHPFFMKKAPEPGEQLSPLMEGLQKLKYDPNENTPEELAISYKDDGNFNFKHKNYRLAVISYTEGIKTGTSDSETIAVLYNNRAAAHYFLQNYRSSLKDCESALKRKPSYQKAIVRAAHCCLKLSEYDKCIKYCDEVLLMDCENTEVLDLRKNAEIQKKKHERDVREAERRRKKQQKEENLLLSEIRERGIVFESPKNISLELSELEPTFPEIAQRKVHLGENNKLVWPVIFLYPEYETVDFIQEFEEDSIFQDHILEVFASKPDWDVEGKYLPETLNVYYENKVQRKIYKVDVSKSLLQIMQEKNFTVTAGTPSFLIFARDSSAEKIFKDSY